MERDDHHPAAGVVLWGTGVILAFAIAFFLVEKTELFGDSGPDVLRHAGLFLQAWGLLLVAHEISDLRSRFGGSPSLPTRTVRWIRHVWNRLRHRKPTVITLTPNTVRIGGGSVVVAVGRKAPETLEERVAALELLTEEQRTQLKALAAELRREVEERKGQHRDERAARAEGDKRIEDLVKDLAVGGLLLETVGLYWLVLGLAFSTWPEELAVLFNRAVP